MRFLDLAPALCLVVIGGAPAMAQMSLAQACDDASPSGVEYRDCASRAFDAADAELNEVYRLALTRAKAFDADAAAEGMAGPLTLEEALRQAQRDWIAFRDSDCDVLAVTYLGGTGGPPAGTICRAEKSLARAQALRTMMSDY